MPRRSRPYETGLRERLRDSEYATSYVKACLEDSIDGFLLALRDVAESQYGFSHLAEAADLNRENLYRMLSADGNPTVRNLAAVLKSLGLRLSVEKLCHRPVAVTDASWQNPGFLTLEQIESSPEALKAYLEDRRRVEEMFPRAA
jgi:probable addiction module antidote protein